MNYREWKYKYLLKGKTKGIYSVGFLSILFGAMVLFDRLDFFRLILSLIALIASYAVFTDLYAHLFYDSYYSGITKGRWFRLLLRGRCHDITGLLIALLCSAFLGVIPFVLSFLSAGIVIYYIYKTRFYH